MNRQSTNRVEAIIAIMSLVLTILLTIAFLTVVMWATFSEPAPPPPSVLERRVTDIEAELGEVSQEVVNLHQQINDLQARAKECE